jgi:hypothetical protein
MTQFTQKIADQIPVGLDRYDQLFEAKRLINKTDSHILATCRETLEEIEEIIFQREKEIIFQREIKLSFKGN